jgi:hypothetical protein
MTISGATYREGIAFNADGAMYVAIPSGGTLTSPTLSNPTITGTVTASQVTGIESVIAQWGVPVILASSGTMGNNGAVSGMTALPTTYSGGAWLYLPAGAVAAGVPAAAAFLWFVASSTTAGTVYNSTWDGSGIPALGTTTAFATTGPGAFTGVAAGEITVATITVPAGAMGPNGVLKVSAHADHNTAVGNKITRVRLSGGAGTAFWSLTTTTTPLARGNMEVRNLGGAALQAGGSFFTYSGGAQGMTEVYAAVNTAVATTLVFTLEKATATNHVLWLGATVSVVYGA